jgi:hypothetical protein
MSRAIRRNGAKYAKAKRPAGGFLALPHAVIRSKEYRALSPFACKLLIDLLSQYDGSNNGDFCCAWSIMEPCGWRSRATLRKALIELIETGFVSQTRQGGRHLASLYGVTIYALDERAKLEVRTNGFPRGAWQRREAGEGPKRRSYPTARAKRAAIDTPDGLHDQPSTPN